MNSQQRITSLQIKVEALESRMKEIQKMIDKYYSVLSCEYWIDGRSYKMMPAIVELIKRDALRGK